MKRLLLLSLLFVPAQVCALSSGSGPHKGVMSVAPSGGGAAFALETVATNYISSGTTTSSSMTFTTTANTKLIVIATVWRRNIGQNPVSPTFNGDVFTELRYEAASMAGTLHYLRNPDVGTYNIVMTLSASTAGFAMSALSFTGVNNNPVTDAVGAAGTVTTSTQTQTTAVGDFVVGLLTKQDPTTSNPTKNTAGDTLQNDFTYSSSGNGGFFKLTTSTATATSTDSNFSWTTTGQRAHVSIVVKP